jgi:AraC-like DNA-binding protein
LAALYDACVSLLPLAAGCVAGTKKDETTAFSAGYLLREILDFVNRGISDTELSPQRVAEHFGISVRYVHKLFACSGMTFGSYVSATRLDHIRRELSSPSCRRQPISAFAYRWGFGDISTFNRAFKHRFGCTPSNFRQRSGPLPSPEPSWARTDGGELTTS